MFKKKKDIAKVTTSATTTGTTTQSSTVRRLFDNSIEKRTITQITTSRYSSVVTSTKETESTVIRTNNNGVLNLTGARPSTLSSNLANRTQQIDAKPFIATNTRLLKSSSSNNVGYQSPFSRRLTPLTSSSTDARPFNSQLELKLPSTNLLRPPSAFPRNQPTYSSYHPSTTSNINSPLVPSSSTQSLPCSNEASQNRDPRIPTYNTSGKKRGKVLVINNVKFLKELDERRGAETDEKNISKLFKNMGFDVDTCRDLKQAAMLNKVTKFKNDSSLKNVDMSILIMMSHGNNVDHTGRVIRGGFTQIFGTDDKGLHIDDILNLFSTETCPALAGKPKIFIFQCCRGEKSETLHNDAAPIRNVVKKHGDMLIAFSTLPGFYSIRDTLQGSWYIQCICEVFTKHAKEFDVETLLKIVDRELSKKHPKYQQTSTYESRGFQCCYLNPK